MWLAAAWMRRRSPMQKRLSKLSSQWWWPHALRARRRAEKFLSSLHFTLNFWVRQSVVLRIPLLSERLKAPSIQTYQKDMSHHWRNTAFASNQSWTPRCTINQCVCRVILFHCCDINHLSEKQLTSDHIEPAQNSKTTTT